MILERAGPQAEEGENLRDFAPAGDLRKLCYNLGGVICVGLAPTLVHIPGLRTRNTGAG